MNKLLNNFRIYRLRVSILLFTLIVLCELMMPSCSNTQKPGEETINKSIYFENVLKEAGIDFQHYGERHRWCEIGPQVQGLATNEEIMVDLFENPLEFANKHLIRMNGSGAAWLDYDNDGDWDLYLVNGAGGEDVTNALYENNGNGRFTPLTSECGALDSGEGMAVSTADYNNDGFTDLFVTNFGGFVLYKNNGNGTFSDVTNFAFKGRIENWWYGGSAWGDYNKDGFLDLYVCGYVDLLKRPHDTDSRFPMDFEGYPNTLYHNNGDGTFKIATDQARVGDAYRKSMQVLFADFNEDNWPDIFVINDTDPNSLYLNRGDDTFIEFSGPSGTSSTDGSMGIAYGDYSNDGKMDLFISNYTGEADLLFNLVDNQTSNDGVVKNAIYMADFNSPILQKRTWDKVGWGTGLFDLDNDGDLDLFIANGHLNAVSGDNRDELLIFENNGSGIFSDYSEKSNVKAVGKRIYRSALFADYNDDGKIDIYVVNNGEKSFDEGEDRSGVLLKNSGAGGNNWLKIRLQGVKSNRDGFGAKVRMTAAGKTQIRELVSGSGYFSANAKELHLGLGKAELIDRLDIIWPSGIQQAFDNIEPNRTILIVEGKDI